MELFRINEIEIFSFENVDELYIAYIYEVDRVWEYYEIFLAKTEPEKVSGFIHNKYSLRSFFENGVIFLLSSQESISINNFSLEEIIESGNLASNLDFNWVNIGALDLA